MTPKELREILGKVGINEVRRRTGATRRQVLGWTRQRGSVPEDVARNLIGLVQFEPITPREIRAIVSRAGGRAAVLSALGIQRQTLSSWMAGTSHPRLPRVWALRELWARPARPPAARAAHRRVRERRRDGEGLPVRRSRHETVACIEHIGAVLRASLESVAVSELARRIGTSRLNLRYPLRRAVRSGLVAAEGHPRAPRYRALASAPSVTASAPPLWGPPTERVERPRYADGRPVRRTQAEMRIDVDRVLALVAKCGPMPVCEIRAVLGVHPRHAHGTVNHAERVGIVVRRRHQRYPVVEIRRSAR